MGLRDQIRKDIESQNRSKVDWEAHKIDWIDSVEKLYVEIKTWFDELTSEELLTFKESEKVLNESFIGSYTIGQLHLKFANGKEVIIEPLGTIIIGAQGRLDMFLHGYNSKKYMILKQKNESGEFSWMLKNTEGRGDIVDLNKENLEKVFEGWLS